MGSLIAGRHGVPTGGPTGYSTWSPTGVPKRDFQGLYTGSLMGVRKRGTRKGIPTRGYPSGVLPRVSHEGSPSTDVPTRGPPQGVFKRGSPMGVTKWVPPRMAPTAYGEHITAVPRRGAPRKFKWPSPTAVPPPRSPHGDSQRGTPTSAPAEWSRRGSPHRGPRTRSPTRSSPQGLHTRVCTREFPWGSLLGAPPRGSTEGVLHGIPHMGFHPRRSKHWSQIRPSTGGRPWGTLLDNHWGTPLG
jgi:hypothetical protein